MPVIDGVEFTVRTGTTGLVPRATWHSINNKSSGTSKAVSFKAKTTGEIPLIAEKYGVVYK